LPHHPITPINYACYANNSVTSGTGRTDPVTSAKLVSSLAASVFGVAQALPLAIWILLSVGAGACTSVFITGLFKLSNYFARYQPRYRRNSVEVLELNLGSKINLTKQPPPVTLSQTPTQSLKTLPMIGQ